MRDFLYSLFVASLIFQIESAAESDNRPNVLFIAIDDLNACIEGMDGETTVPTPNITRLADRGVFFTNAHCAAPACNPSRVSVMTGLAPSTSGIYTNKQDWRLVDSVTALDTLPHLFRKSGYETLGGGKLYHAASLKQASYGGYIDARPWDEYFPSKEQQMPYEALPDESVQHGNKEFYGGRFSWAALDIEPEEMADAKVVDWARSQLTKEHEKPLFLAVGIYRPHIPWYTPKQYFDLHPLDKVALPETVENDLDDIPEAGKEMSRRDWHQWLVDNNKWEEFVRGYNASVSFTDDMVGRLFDALDNGPLAENTVVVLWSDHGYHLGQKEHWEKFALWEQTTRVPLIVVAPGVSAVGGNCDQPVSLLDLYPTLSELCGLEPTHALDGTSLVPLLKDPGEKTGRAVVCTQGFQNHAIRSDRWRYIRYEDGSEELYDHIADPREFSNVADREENAEIKMELANWLPKMNKAAPESKGKD